MAIAISLLLSCHSLLHAEDYRVYTDVEGRAIRAKALGLDGDEVTILRDDGRQFTFSLTRLIEPDRDYLLQQFSQDSPDILSPDTPRLKPGEVITLDFPDLPAMAGNQSSKCEVRIPDSYNPQNTYPLFVWFAGGKGSYKVGGANELVDFERFIVVALPYPGGRLPRLAVNDGTIDAHWEYLAPMLEEVKKRVPNISETVRIAGGTSSGAHLVGSGICQEWDDFSDYFTAYVLHEGGYAPKKDYDAAKRKPVLVIYGEKSPAYGWQKGFNEAIKGSRADLTFIAMPTDGHGLSGEGRKRIREWTDALVLKEMPSS